MVLLRTLSYILEELLRYDTGTGIDRQLHLADLLVDLLHEGDDEVHQLVLVHLLRVEVGDEETDVIALHDRMERWTKKEKRNLKKISKSNNINTNNTN